MPKGIKQAVAYFMTQQKKLWTGSVTEEKTQIQMEQFARFCTTLTPEELQAEWREEEARARERDPHAVARWGYRYLQATVNKDYKDAAEAKAWAKGYFIHAANLRDMEEKEFNTRWKTKAQKEGAWKP